MGLMSTDTALPMVVFKIGGSLLDLPDLPARLGTLLAQRQDFGCVLLAGGGTHADVVRIWSKRFNLSEPAAHAIAMRSLDLSAMLLCEILPQSQLCEHTCELWRVLREGGTGIVPGERWFRNHPACFPHTWEVTSDSLAAVIASQLDARELILVKSTSLPERMSPEEASHAGLVDRYFPTAAGGVRQTGWANLRSEPIVIEPWIRTAGTRG